MIIIIFDWKTEKRKSFDVENQTFNTFWPFFEVLKKEKSKFWQKIAFFT